MSLTKRLADRGLIQPPRWLPDNVQYEAVAGSQAYGMSGDTADWDCYGFCIPPKELVFPHLAGRVPLFDWPSDAEMWTEYQRHHIRDESEDRGRGRNYDLTIYSLVRYLALCAEGNPNLIDTLFVRHTAVLTCTQVAQKVRDARHLFLHRGCFAKFRGYATNQIHKMLIKAPQPESRRAALVEEHGYDVKFASHAVRLLLEAEQLLLTGDLDLQRDRETLKEIRRGEWSLQQVREYFATKERQLEELLPRSSLPAAAPKDRIKTLLLECLEEHYGDLSAEVLVEDRSARALRDIRDLVDRALGS